MSHRKAPAQVVLDSLYAADHLKQTWGRARQNQVHNWKPNNSRLHAVSLEQRLLWQNKAQFKVCVPLLTMHTYEWN